MFPGKFQVELSQNSYQHFLKHILFHLYLLIVNFCFVFRHRFDTELIRQQEYQKDARVSRRRTAMPASVVAGMARKRIIQAG